MTPAEAEPYLVVRRQTRLCEEAMIRFCGITDIPTFDQPDQAPAAVPEGRLGQACGGTKIEPCRAWLQARAPKRTVEGREIQMIVDDQKLATVLCRVCKG